MRVLKKIALGLLIILILIQFIPGSVNRNGQSLATDIVNDYQIPAEVHSILKKACYDCHSNNSRYPWYARVQPFRLMLDRHIRLGKEELNFSEYGSYSKKKQYNKFRSIAESLEEGTMPLKSYQLLHADTKLNDAEKAAVLKWVEDKRNLIKEGKE